MGQLATLRDLAALWERTAGLLADELHQHSLASGEVVQQHVLAELQAAALANMRLKVCAASVRPVTPRDRAKGLDCNSVVGNLRPENVRVTCKTPNWKGKGTCHLVLCQIQCPDRC